ncbi:MAG: hypothetical protein OEX00_08655, partial [Gammaproteobacteria bacterium]|nr:hypothetical protein [Gammaproteobacteria bacterium]
MIKWVNYFVRLCFLKAQPEEAPFSKIAQYTTVLVYWFLGVILLLSTQPYVSSIILSFIQTVIFLFLTSLVLWIKNLPERINQTITALMGTGAFITFVALPIVYGTGDLSSTGGSLWMLIAIVLLLW